jgi:hypothetical protein
MSDKKQLHHKWVIFRRIKPRYFLLLFVVSLLVAAFALRANNLHMLALRNQVYKADKSNGNVEKALKNLRHYVIRHMNTNLSSGPDGIYPPIQLKYTYKRTISSRDAESNKSNAQIYRDAQKYCEAKIPHGFSGRYRISCIESYIEQHKIKEGRPAPKSLYGFDFVSPTWSPDLAGWSLVASAFFALLFLLSLITRFIFKSKLRRHA